METQNYTKKAIKNFIIITIFTLSAALVSYIYRIFLARSLTVEEYGLFFSVFSLVALIYSFRDISFYESLTKFIPEFKVNKDEKSIKESFVYVTIIGFIMSIIIFILFIIFSGFLAKNYIHDVASMPLIILVAISFILYGGELLLKQTFQGYQEMILFSTIGLFKSVFIFALTYVFLKLGLGLIGISYAYILAPVLTITIYSFIFFKKVFPNFFLIKINYNKPLLKRLFRFAIPTFLGVGFGVIITYTDIIMLTLFSGVFYVGLYNIALPTANFLAYITIGFRNVIYPLSSELWSKKHMEHLSQGIVFIHILIILIFFSEIIIKTLFGQEYIGANNTLKILSIGIFILSVAQINYAVLAGIGKPELNTKTSFIAALLNIVLNAILIPFFNIIGAALATLICYLFMFIASFKNIKSKIQLNIPFIIWLKTIIAGAVFLIVVNLTILLFGLNELNALIAIIVALIFYILSLFVLKVVTITEIKDICKRIDVVKNGQSNNL